MKVEVWWEWKANVSSDGLKAARGSEEEGLQHITAFLDDDGGDDDDDADDDDDDDDDDEGGDDDDDDKFKTGPGYRL